VPPLENHRWEIACQTLASGKVSQAEAYVAASNGRIKKDKAVASRFFSRPEIKARVEEIVAERHALDRQVARKAAEEAEVDRAWIMRHLRHNALAAMRGEPLYGRDGKVQRDAETGAVRYTKPNRDAANRSLELMGREIGMFISRHEVGGPGDFARLTEEELNAQLSQTLQAFGVPEQMVTKLIQDLDGTYRAEES